MVINIKQYLRETNSVLLTEQNYKYLKEKASVIEKLEEIKTEMDIIAELEKIKAYFEELANDEWNIQVGASKGLECAIDVIEDRISELKGE